MDLKLDRDVLKALSSDTRVDILKELSSRRFMQSELASSLSLSVPTIKEHLAALEKAGLVQRHDEGRKWKYYSLTSKGKGVVEPEGTRLWLVLGVWLFSAAATLHMYLKGPIAPFTGEVAPMAAQMKAVPEVMTQSVATDASQLATDAFMSTVSEIPLQPVYPDALYGWLAVAIVASLLVLNVVWNRYKYQRWLGKSLSNK